LIGIESVELFKTKSFRGDHSSVISALPPADRFGRRRLKMIEPDLNLVTVSHKMDIINRDHPDNPATAAEAS